MLTVLVSNRSAALAGNATPEAMRAAYGADLYASTVVNHCRARRAPSAGRLHAVYLAWRTRHRLEGLAVRLPVSALERARIGTEARGRAIGDLRAMANVKAGCAQFIVALRDWDPFRVHGHVEGGEPGVEPVARVPAGQAAEIKPADPRPPAVAPDIAAATVSPSGANVQRIHTVVTDLRQRPGVGGYLYPYYVPLVLFKDGWGCSDMDVLAPGVDLAQHRATHPDSWWRWRLANGRDGWTYEQDKGAGGWERFGRGAAYPPMSRGTKLHGTYAHVSGGGDTALGSNASIAVTGYTFHADGTFSRNGAVSGSSSDAAAGAASGELQGSYLIDGYLLTLRLQSGRVETHSMVGMEGLIYVDGVDYTNGA